MLLSLLTIATTLSGSRPVTFPDTACQVLLPDRVPVAGRKSPLDSLTFNVRGKPVKLCYGRPSSRSRTMIGSAEVPYGKLWRTGANEPTIFFTPIALDLAGLKVPPGKYSLYSVPGPKEWEIIVNRSTTQWGKEDQYTDKVKAQEVGRAKVPAKTIQQPIETFAIRAEPSSGDASALVLEWEKTRLRVPVKAAQ
ncbi:MAG TPA: DUF2911 domain-containing protein [Gemmatimonadales bacterium]